MREVLRLVGARLKELRREHGLRVAEVARALGYDTSTIYGIESARHAISFRHLVALANLLNVDELDLFTFPDVSPRHDLIDLTRGAPPRIIVATRDYLLTRLNDLERQR